LIKHLSKIKYHLFLLCMLIAFDQVTKFIAEGVFYKPIIQDYLAFHFIYNENAPIFKVILGLLLVPVLFIMTYELEKEKCNLAYPIVIIASGALSNTVEALICGKVADFIFVKPLGIIMNFADLFLFLGTGLFLVKSVVFFFKNKST